MITCPECGTRNGLNALLCIQCGRELPPPTRPEPEPVVEPEDTSSLPVVPPLSPDALLAEAADLLADGKAEAAADRCWQVIELEPDRADAHALLGMVQEERGDAAGALAAYQRAIEIDPERPNEVAKVEELQRLVEETSVQEEVAESRARKRWAFLEKHAPVIVAGAAGFFVLLVGIAIVLRVQHNRQLAATEGEYTRLMTAGKDWVAYGDYNSAAQCFQAALNLRPEDEEAMRWYAQSADVQKKVADYDRLNRETVGGKWLGTQSGPSPFTPMPVGSPPPTVQNALMSPAPAAPDFGDVTGRIRRSTGGASSSYVRAPDFGGSPNLPSPVPSIALQPAPAPIAPSAPPAQGTSTPARPRGEVTIWTSDTPAASRPSASSSSAPDAGQLRRQADEYRRQGRAREASDTYRRAIQATEAGAGSPRMKQASIESMQKALSTVEGSGR